MSQDFFVTVDAETEVIADGVETISAIRERVEAQTGVAMPIVWFVRFQRNWGDSVQKESLEFFNGPVDPDRSFDGYALAKQQLLRMQARGDEIAWHYHAYGYVHRDDLDHGTRVALLQADMRACAHDLRRRHPEFSPRSLRFGWWFIPDYSVFPVLAAAGFDIDASIRPDRSGNVSKFAAKYLAPRTSRIEKIDSTWFFPFGKTLCVHDWNPVSHQFNWRKQDEAESAVQREQLERELTRIALKMRDIGGRCATYVDTVRSLEGALARADAT